MINNKKVIALIPARGGSKRLPRKNVLPLAGKPLIAWTIEAANKSKYIDEVYVSTDDNGIATIAQQFGAIVPFIRPENLANDYATTNDVILHFINELGLKSDNILVILQPTSPLRDCVEIDSALNIFNVNQNIDGVVSVCECEHSPAWTNILPENKHMGNFIDEDFLNTRSQDLPIYYRLNGSIYAYRIKNLIHHHGVNYTDSIIAYCMSTWKSVDIDNKIDFIMAQAILSEIESLNS